MRHFDTWVLRDPYSIWHYYSSGQRWQETIQSLIQERAICSPPTTNTPLNPISPMNPQSTSTLSLLPLEIRRMIWAHVFTSTTTHLVTIKNTIRHVRCSSQNPNSNLNLTHHRHCCPLTPARWRIYDGRIPGHSDRLLYPHTHDLLPDNLSNGQAALLRTCQAIYAEASDQLYVDATFDVDDLYTFIAFARSLAPRHLSCIRRVTVQWMPVWQPLSGQDHKGSIYGHTHSDALWIEFWDVVAKLPGLVELGLSIDLGRFAGTTVAGNGNGNGNEVVVVAGGQQRIPLVITEPWLLPLLRVRGLKGFELAVTARCDSAARGALEGDLVRDAGLLRDQLRLVMCSEVGVPLEEIGGLGLKDYAGALEALKEVPVKKRQLAITAC
ncbi:hypothetical protein N7454_005206 [Penicillium verhagenii]|nr:hypothetical protein N7454_005206 [Penicillium verhagenii]